jgi:signal transduction histidine kinase
MSIRIKVILPYLLLTLVVAITGVYVVTRLVSNSLSERLTNQLLEAGRVVSDDVARQEIKHIEIARVIAYTRGFGDALSEEDRSAVAALAKPVAAGLDVENVIVLNLRGQELLHFIKKSDGSFLDASQEMGAGSLSIVQVLLAGNDPSSPPRRGLGINPLDERYYYFTAMPVSSNGQLVGVIVIGTSLERLLPYLKATSLADVIIYAENGQAVATTLGAQSSEPGFLKTLSTSTEEYQQIIAASESVNGANFLVDGRWYSLARSSLRVSDDRIGAFGVVLPLNFVLQSGTTSRNTYVVLFAIAMIGVVLIGYFVSRKIINPLFSLVHTSQAIAGGDLSQRTGIRSSDEIGTLANTFDEMTERLQQRTVELERANQILEKMDQTKASFIQVSAHELRTPLTLIHGYTQILQAKIGTDPEMRQIFQGLLEGSSRMNEIVNSMLDISRIDSKTLQTVQGNVKLDFVMAKVQKVFNHALNERNLTLKVEELESVPTIHADPDLLYKALYHLVMNAIKYTPDGGLIIVSGKLIEDQVDTPEVEVQVSDTGIGIDSQDQDLIFEKFYQTGEVILHSSGKTKFKGGGPGLGLAIVRGIVEAHQGRVWVESPGYDEVKNRGSSFHVRLPVKGLSNK